MKKPVFDSSPQTITIKEVYERVVVLETKLDTQAEESKYTVVRFRRFAITIAVFEVINFILNLILIKYFFRL